MTLQGLHCVEGGIEGLRTEVRRQVPNSGRRAEGLAPGAGAVGMWKVRLLGGRSGVAQLLGGAPPASVLWVLSALAEALQGPSLGPTTCVE